MAEPSLNPPEDELWDRACDKVSDWSEARKIAFMAEYEDDVKIEDWEQYADLARTEVYNQLRDEEQDMEMEAKLDRLEDRNYYG